jgi:hypothetical protein
MSQEEETFYSLFEVHNITRQILMLCGKLLNILIPE